MTNYKIEVSKYYLKYADYFIEAESIDEARELAIAQFKEDEDILDYEDNEVETLVKEVN
jgi:hypothetical protein